MNTIRVVVISLIAAGYGAAVWSQETAPGLVASNVRLSRTALADGKPLPAGVYSVRVTADEPTRGVGQAPSAERWVEFVRAGTVVGREVATVISSADIGRIAESPRPAANSSRVDVLRGGEYLRVWINSGGTNYLINLRLKS